MAFLKTRLYALRAGQYPSQTPVSLSLHGVLHKCMRLGTYSSIRTATRTTNEIRLLKSPPNFTSAWVGRVIVPLSCVFTNAGYTEDVLEYIHVSVPKNMLADLKDSVKSSRSLNLQDKYGATAVSFCMPTYMYMHILGSLLPGWSTTWQ